MHCTICPVGQGIIKREKPMLQMAEIESVIKKEPQLKRVNLNNWGEPLLHPWLPDIIMMIKKHIPDCYISFATNGYWLGSVVKRVIKSGLDEIQLSLDGMGKTYESIRQGVTYKEVLESIDKFLILEKVYNPEGKLKIIAKMVVTPDNEKFTDEFKLYWDSRGVEVRFQPLMFHSNEERTKPCPEMFNELVVVLSDGRIVPCCGDYNGHLIIGDIATSTLTQAWNSETAELLRQLHESGNFNNTCKKCNEYKTPLVKERFQ
jgi:radical SAM protein with 4Fe4S-binding SPASM domain